MKVSVRRVIMSISGVLILAVAVSMYKVAAMGVDPFQVLVAGLDRMIPLEFGLVSLLTNAVMLIFSIVCDRRNIGVNTFVNMFLLGYVIQFLFEALHPLVPDPSLPVRVLFLLGGVAVGCFGSALYMTASLGVSTYDAFAITMADKWKLGPFKYIRIGTDLLCVISGTALYLLAGGAWSEVPAFVGVGTIITAFFMGPLIEFFNVKVARPLLKNEK